MINAQAVQKFKGSNVQGSRTLDFPVLELLNPLNLERAFAQANFYQGKTISHDRRHRGGDAYDLWARLMAAVSANIFPAIRRSSCRICRARRHCRCKSCLQRRQARWLDSWLVQPSALLRPTREKTGGEVRLEQVRLDRESGDFNHMMYMRADAPYNRGGMVVLADGGQSAARHADARLGE